MPVAPPHRSVGIANRTRRFSMSKPALGADSRNTSDESRRSQWPSPLGVLGPKHHELAECFL